MASPTRLPLGLTLFAADTEFAGSRPAVLVLPGGGYGGTSEHEGAPVARWLNGLGFHAAVLRYRAPALYPSALLEAHAALLHLRSAEHGLDVDPTSVGVIGSSAGGHLAASLSNPDAHGLPGADRPAFAILCYPVISLGTLPDGGSYGNLLGADAPASPPGEQQAHLTVTDRTPPTFIWHTADDSVVPVMHALLYAEALAAHSVDLALHVFARGAHGLGLAQGAGDVERWTGLCAEWLATTAGGQMDERRL